MGTPLQFLFPGAFVVVADWTIEWPYSPRSAGVCVPDMTHLKRCGFLGVRCPSEKDCAEQRKKDSVYPIGDGEKEIKIKPGAQTKKGPTMGLEPTWV